MPEALVPYPSALHVGPASRAAPRETIPDGLLFRFRALSTPYSVWVMRQTLIIESAHALNDHLAFYIPVKRL